MAWHTVCLPGSTHALALLWRDREENAWTKARSLTLADDTGSFPPGAVRIVNVSPGPVQVAYGEEGFELGSGKVEMRGGKGVALVQVGLEIKAENDRGRMVRVFSGSITQDAGERTNVIIYRADGERPRRPVKVYLRPENSGKTLAPVRPR
ncbi:MAG: hypothetical protein GWO24_15465 [Akkermansiaceae bacterium]|nr:hypothetical protein [Akkermansiaceae bacterium]